MWSHHVEGGTCHSPRRECVSLKGHFTHKTEGPWPLHFKHSHWWKRWSWSKFASHYAWETNGVCECKMDVKSTWILTWRRLDHVSWSLGLFQKPPLEGRPDTKLGDHYTPNVHNRWCILFYHVWEPAWIKICWNSNCLRAQSRMTSHYILRVRDHTTWFWRCVGTAFGHFLLGSHNFMVTALGSCVKWP